MVHLYERRRNREQVGSTAQFSGRASANRSSNQFRSVYI